MLTQEQITKLSREFQYVGVDILTRIANAGYAVGEAAMREQNEKLKAALDYVIRDLELRANMKFGTKKGLVDIGNGAYQQAKEALKETP